MKTGDAVVTNRDIPLFSGVIKKGTDGVVLSSYQDAMRLEMLNVRFGEVEISGLATNAVDSK